MPSFLGKASGADTAHAVEIAPRIWWVSCPISDDPFQCNAYLIENGDHSILIDPGGYLTLATVLRKVEEVVPFSKVRYFICHHQDPDIAGALREVDRHPQRNPDAVIVTHWRAIHLLKHYDPKMPFYEIEKKGWRLDAGARALRFIFTPYLHFPGAFCTFDETSGVLFSSDLFGGFTENWRLVAGDESCFDDIRPFHEHYMPSREILLHSLLKLEGLPIRTIAPQHGSVLPEALVPYVFNKLKQTDCGIYAMGGDRTDIMRLSALTRALKEITNLVVMYRDLKDIVRALMGILEGVIRPGRIEFYARTEGGETIRFSPENRYRGTVAALPEWCRPLLGVKRTEWFEEHPAGYNEVHPFSEGEGHAVIIPLFYQDGIEAEGVAVIEYTDPFERSFELDSMLSEVARTLGVAIEREAFYRMIDLEREKFYERSIRDPLTGLYNRLYMVEFVKKLMHIHDRRSEDSITAIMFDIDHFKDINDAFGHATGDGVLKRVADILVRRTRDGDIAVRYGGEEFALFLSRCPTRDAAALAERIRREVAGAAFDGLPAERRITVSAGVAARRPGEGLGQFLERADRALYEAKRGGRDRVCIDDGQ